MLNALSLQSIDVYRFTPGSKYMAQSQKSNLVPGLSEPVP